MTVWITWDGWDCIIATGTTFEILKKYLVEQFESNSMGYIDEKYVSLYDAYGEDWKQVLINTWQKKNFEDFIGDPHELRIREIHIYDD